MEPYTFMESSNGCTDTPGFKAAGVHCDVRGKKDGRLDLALVVSDVPCTVAGVFTMNRMAAAPVRLGREQLGVGGLFRGFITNSGNANACTGPEGMGDALVMRKIAADGAGLAAEELFVCSTGRIGKRLPMDVLAAGIDEAASILSPAGQSGLNAADAILTSDTRRKVCSIVVNTSQGAIHLSGMAKGAGMIEPNMATMLGFICTDANISQDNLQAALRGAVKDSFNAITVDGDESTNDTVLLLANGVSEIHLEPGNTDWAIFIEALQSVCEDLARKIVGDGEKITKVVEIQVNGAATEADANLAARAVGNSLLVKSSWYGNDPNWGRVMDALGYSGALLAEETTEMWYSTTDESEPVPAFLKGRVLEENLGAWKAIVVQAKFRIIINLGQGTSTCRIWSSDLTEGYVDFNKSE